MRVPRPGGKHDSQGRIHGSGPQEVPGNAVYDATKRAGFTSRAMWNGILCRDAAIEGADLFAVSHAGLPFHIAWPLSEKTTVRFSTNLNFARPIYGAAVSLLCHQPVVVTSSLLDPPPPPAPRLRSASIPHEPLSMSKPPHPLWSSTTIQPSCAC